MRVNFCHGAKVRPQTRSALATGNVVPRMTDLRLLDAAVGEYLLLRGLGEAS
jgi:hypothetical protein